MKKAFVFLIIIIFSFTLISCSDLNNNIVNTQTPLPETTIPKTEFPKIESNELTEEKTIELYNRFLNGEISAKDGTNMDSILIPTGEPDERRSYNYAFFDSSGDGLPELHISSFAYYIFTVKDGSLAIWQLFEGTPFYYPLKNGAFIARRYRETQYRYYIFNHSGKEMFSLSFAKQDINFDGTDEYFFNNIEIDKKTWNQLTEPYLYIDEQGLEQIRNQIEFTYVPRK